MKEAATAPHTHARATCSPLRLLAAAATEPAADEAAWSGWLLLLLLLLWTRDASKPPQKEFPAPCRGPPFKWMG